MRIIIITILIFTSISCQKNQIDMKPKYELRLTTLFEENGKDTIQKDINAFYHLRLDRTNHQTVRRVTGYIRVNGGTPIPSEKIEWTGNLFWWVQRGDTVAQITKMYINKLTGQVQYINYPPIISQVDALVPTVNCCSYNANGGEINTMIAPVSSMVGDTLIVEAYSYSSELRTTVKIVLE